ncbi:MAG: polyphosphate glucokinase [Myxococcaceae bacterium]|nr:polyphosphate glucokinase [Myxococcaceae bacterium]
MKVLVVDVGGTHVKVLATGQERPQKVDSGPTMTAQQMVDAARELSREWEYEVVSIGFPGPVLHDRPVAEPHNLGPGWVSFDFEKAFERPVRVINDAAMQALGSYDGGRMLFLGLGTGLGSALIIDGVVAPLELAHLPYKKGKTYEDYVGLRGLERLGKKKWRAAVADVSQRLKAAMQADDLVLGGGNAQLLKEVPEGMRLGDNANAFLGGYRLWQNVEGKEEGARAWRREAVRGKPNRGSGKASKADAPTRSRAAAREQKETRAGKAKVARAKPA